MDSLSNAIKKGRFTIQEIEYDENEINLHMLLRRRYSSIRKFGHELLLIESNSNNSDRLDEMDPQGIVQSKTFLCQVLEGKSRKHVLFDKVWESVPQKMQIEFNNFLIQFDQLIEKTLLSMAYTVISMQRPL